MTLPGWPPTQPFPESQREREPGAGPDFPGSSGGREQGKFRPGNLPYTDVVAVSGDDGQPVTRDAESLLTEMLAYQKAILLALALTSEGASFTVDEVLASVS